MTAQDARERARGAIIRIYDIIEATASKNEQHAAVDSAVAEFDLQWRAAKRDYEERIAALVAAVRLIIADVVADPYTRPDISALQSAIARWSELDTNDK